MAGKTTIFIGKLKKIMKIFLSFLAGLTMVSFIIAGSMDSDLRKKTDEWYKNHPDSHPHWLTTEEEKQKIEDEFPKEAKTGHSAVKTFYWKEYYSDTILTPRLEKEGVITKESKE